MSGGQTTTDGSGVATATLTADVTGNGPIVVKATVNGVEYEVTVTIDVSYALEFGTVTGGSDFVSGASTTATIPVTLLQNGRPYTTSTTVTWSIVSANNSANQAVVSSHQSLATGLAWGNTAISPTSAGDVLTDTTSSSTSTVDGTSSIQLTDIMGERKVTVLASVSIGGQSYTEDLSVTFGAGPLSVFKAPLSGMYRWADNYPISNADNSAVSNFPAAYACGTGLSAADLRDLPDGYHTATNLPSVEQLRAISEYSGNGAWVAAGWPDPGYWTGLVNYGGYNVHFVIRNGDDHDYPVRYDVPVVCLR